MTKCVFCRKAYKNLVDLSQHYVQEHSLAKNDPYLKEYIEYFYNRQKGRKTNNAGAILCSSCAGIYNDHKTLLRHKLRRHTQQVGGALEMNSLVTTSYKSTDIFSSYCISITSDKYPREYDWHNPSVVDAFLANAKAKFDQMRQSAIVNRTDSGKSLKFNIVYVIINQKNEGGYHTFSTPWSKTSQTYTGDGFFPTIVTKLSDSVKTSILVNNENGSAYYFYAFEKLELNIIETKNTTVLGEIFGGKEKTKINFSPITKETMSSSKIKIFTRKPAPPKKKRKRLVVYSDTEDEDEEENNRSYKLPKTNNSVIDFEAEVDNENDKSEEKEEIAQIEKDEIENHFDFINDNSSEDEEVDINQLRILTAKNIFIENGPDHTYFNSEDESEESEFEELTEEQEKELNQSGVLPNDRVDETINIGVAREQNLTREKDSIIKLLVRPQNKEGECIYESILGSLLYHYTSGERLRVAATLNDKFEQIPENVMDIMKRHREMLKYLSKEEFMFVITALNDELKNENIYLNVFLLEDNNSYIVSDLNAKTEISRGNQNKPKKRIKQTISFIKTLFLGISDPKSGNGVQLIDNNIKLVNLVVIPGRKENEVTYATDISKFFKCLLTEQIKDNEKISIKQLFACKRCLKLYIQKKTYQKHEEVCNGPATPQFNFSDRHIINYKDYLNLYNKQPYTLYYDVETDSNASRVIAYSTSVAFSLDMKLKVKNWYLYRHIHMNQRQLTDYRMIPDVVLGSVDRSDKRLLSASADNVFQKKDFDTLASHMVLEHFCIDKWVREYLRRMVVPQNKNLTIKEKTDFRTSYDYKKDTRCCICRFPIDLKKFKADNTLRDLPRMTFEIEQEYIRVLEALVNEEESYMYLANLGEKDFIGKVITIAETMLLTKDIETGLSLGINELKDVRVHSKDLHKYLVDNEFKDLGDFIMFLKRSNNLTDFKIAASIMSFEQKKLFPEWFQFSNDFFTNLQSIYDDDNYVIHHDHYTRKIYGYAHPSCNSALQNPTASSKTTIYAHNAAKFDLAFVRRGIKLSDWCSKDLNFQGSDRVDGITLGSRIMYRDTLKFFQEALADLVASADDEEKDRIQHDIEQCLLSSDTFAVTYTTLSTKDKLRVLELLLLKNAIPYDMFYDIEFLNSTEFPEIEGFTSTLKNKHIDEFTYNNTKELYYLLNCKNLHALVEVYSYGDIVFLTVIAQNRFHIMGNIYGNEPKNFSSLTMQSKASMLLMTKASQSTPSTAKQVNLYESASFGGYAGTPIRCFFDSTIINSGKPVFANIPSKENRTFEKKRTIKHIFKLDENNQYGMSMDQPLPVGAFTEITVNKARVVKLIEEYDRHQSDFGHVLVIDIRPPPNTKENEIYLNLAEIYLPVFMRKAIQVKHLSLYQRREKKELRSDKKG